MSYSKNKKQQPNKLRGSKPSKPTKEEQEEFKQSKLRKLRLQELREHDLESDDEMPYRQ